MNCLICVHENPLITYEWESTYNKRGLWESLCIYPPISSGISRYSFNLVLISCTGCTDPHHYRDRSVKTGIFCEQYGAGQVFLTIFIGPSSPSHTAGKYFVRWMFTKEKTKGFREEREEGGREGWEGKIIQTWVKAGSHRIDLMVQLFHL